MLIRAFVIDDVNGIYFVIQWLYWISWRSWRRSCSTSKCQRLQRLNIFLILSSKIHFYLLDEKKLQQTADEGDDEDLPHIDLNEMLADMTMEDSDKMDS